MRATTVKRLKRILRASGERYGVGYMGRHRNSQGQRFNEYRQALNALKRAHYEKHGRTK